MSFRSRKTITVMLSVALTACGGGGDTPKASTSDTSVNQSLTTVSSSDTSPKASTSDTSVDQSLTTVSSSDTSHQSGTTTEPSIRKIVAYEDFAIQRITGAVAGNIDGMIFVSAGANIDYVDTNGKTGLAVPKDTGNVAASACMHRQSTDGPHPCFTDAGSMDLDSAGNLYVNDAGMLRKVTPDRAATTVAVFFPSNGFGISPKVFTSNPTVDTHGNVYIAVNYTDIAAEKPGGVFIKKISPEGGINDLMTDTPFNYIYALRVDKAQNLYINYNGKIIKRTPDGVMMPIADVSLPKGQGSVSSLVLDSKGNIYVTSNSYPDNVPHVSIIKITPDGKTSTLIDNMAISGNLIGPDILPAVRDGVLYAITLP